MTPIYSIIDDFLPECVADYCFLADHCIHHPMRYFENYANYLINMHASSPKTNQVMRVVISIFILSFVKIRQTVLPQTRWQGIVLVKLIRVINLNDQVKKCNQIFLKTPANPYYQFQINPFYCSWDNARKLGRTDGRMEGQTDRQTDRQTDIAIP